jgi:homoaconitase/3-isopropylmalate dehydratase large subunit
VPEGNAVEKNRAMEAFGAELVVHGRDFDEARLACAAAAEREGILPFFRQLGAVVSPAGCGSCIGNGPGVPLPGETTASTTNRNFDRRMGAPGPVYLVSPAVAAACAVAGRLVDPRELAPALS